VSTLTEIEAAADALPKEQKDQLLAFLAARLGRTPDSIGIAISGSARRAGLHTGAWEVAQDFDAPLPDEFWLGRDASSSSSIRTHSFGGTATNRTYLPRLWLHASHRRIACT
jgi:hypothetical protein